MLWRHFGKPTPYIIVMSVAVDKPKNRSTDSPFPPDKFVTKPGVVVFAEHRTRLRDGTPVTANQGDAIVAVSDRNTYGETVWVYPETISVRSDGSTLSVVGSRTAPLGRGDRNWPQGSGASFTLPMASLDQSLLANPGFEDIAAANTPQGWTIHTGTPGTTILVTEPEQQQITITGSPTGGYFVLTWTDPLAKVWQTTPLGPAATASDIQTALRGIPGFASVTVTGTNPFTVTFENTPGDIAQLQVINRLTGGTSPQVTVTTTRAGDVLSYRGRSLKLVGNRSEQTSLYQPVRLRPGSVYLLFARAPRPSPPESPSDTAGKARNYGPCSRISTICGRSGSCNSPK